MSEEASLDEYTDSEYTNERVETPIGKLPSDWDVEWLNDVTHINPDGFSEEDWPSETFEYISLSEVSDGEIKESKTVPLEEAPSRAQRRVQEGDVLVGTVRPKQVSHGFVTAENNGKICSSGFGVLRTGPKINPHYLMQEVLSHRFYGQMDAYVAGSGYPAIKIGDLKKHRVSIPPLEEQRKIATVLDNVDQALQKNEQVVEQAERVKKGVIQENVIDKISKASSPTELGEVPEDWETVKLAEVASEEEEDSLVDGPFGSSLKAEEFVEDGFARILQLQNVKEGWYSDSNIRYVDKETYEDLRRHSAKPGDVFIAKMASPVARACILPDKYEHYMLGCADVVRLTPSEDFVDEFVVYCLNSYPVWKQAAAHIRGSGRLRVNLNQLKGVELPKPPLREQEKIVTAVEAITDYIESHKNEKERLRRIKRGLMQDLLSGTVRTTETNIEVPEEIAQHG